MTTPLRETARSPGPIGHGRFVQILAALYGLVFLWSAIAPHDRSDWALENALVLAAAGVLAATHRRFRLSNASWSMILVFLALHAVGSHYTYSLAPPGDWLGAVFGSSRNHYDRVVHFSFGLLLAYPLFELCRSALRLEDAWAFVVPGLTVLSFSAAYEIVEFWAARLVAPELGIAFVGTQGDEWDAQKDMSLAVLGALIALAATALHWRVGRQAQ